MATERKKIEIQNIVSPGHVTRVDKVKYDAMKDALLTALSREQTALTVAEAKQKLLPLLPDDLFPGGAKAGWWLKAVQLDLEAKGVLRRENTKLLRLRLA
ncbi:DUF6958 family protein [Ensifer sp. 4252]|uniref:DUF6958 family protein n=1 Tax=Ensifer sp. 4252 TaxID=3373915 RepID=UPI003D1CD611